MEEKGMDSLREDDQVDLYDLHHYVESVRKSPTVGDAIRTFRATCGGDYCEGCGKADISAGQCKGCHVANYCTIECQQRDWKNGGHAVECKAIATGETMQIHAGTLVADRHLARCSALALAKMATTPTAQDPVPDHEDWAALQAHIGSFMDGRMQLEPLGKNWMAGAVKHPGSFRRAAARADHGRYKGRTTAFAHHVLANRDHKHNSGLLRKRASLALTFARFRRGGGGHRK
jgi:hypothetical protein